MISAKKNLGTPEKDWTITQIGINDLGIVSRYEQTAWPASIQASRQTFLNRFEYGHFMLGIWRQEQLVGLASWRRGWFDPTNKLAFPQTFDEFSNAPNTAPYNAAFAYNLSIRPDHRGREMTRALILAVMDYAREDDCQYVVGDGRCPSYNGSNSPSEKIKPSAEFKLAITRQLQSGHQPSLNDYLADPILRFYYRMLDCQFLWPIQNFIPADIASGGYRVIFYKKLSP